MKIKLFAMQKKSFQKWYGTGKHYFSIIYRVE